MNNTYHEDWWHDWELELMDLDAAWLCIAHHLEDADIEPLEGKGLTPGEAIADLRDQIIKLGLAK